MAGVVGEYSFLGPDMSSNIARQRKSEPVSASVATAATTGEADRAFHPAGRVRYHGSTQVLRILTCVAYFLSACCT